MAQIICEEEGGLGHIKPDPKKCNKKKGYSRFYWTKFGNIDWEATVNDPTLFDPENCCISGYVMTGEELWYCVVPQKKTATYSSVWTEDTGYYTNIINAIFEGQDINLRKAICDALECCNIVVHMFTNDVCGELVFGVDWNGTEIELGGKSLRIIEHGVYGGVQGGDESRNELNIGGETECAPLFANVGLDAFIANYEAPADPGEELKRLMLARSLQAA